MTADLNYLWQKLLDHLRANGSISAGLSTPGEIATQADRARHDALVSQFVNHFLYPVIYGGEDSALGATEAAALVDRIVGGQEAETSDHPRNPGTIAGEESVTIEGLGSFPSIMEALRAVTPGGTIHLAPGIYRESLTIDKNIVLAGKGSASSIIIRGAGAPSITITGGEAKLRNMTLQCVRWNKEDWATALRIEGGSPHVEECRFDGTDGNSAVLIAGDAQPILSRCEIFSGRKSTGIHYSYRSAGQVIECRINEVNVGIILEDRAQPTILKSTLGPYLSNAVLCKGESQGSFVDAEMKHDMSAIKEGDSAYPLFYIQDQASPRIERCKITDAQRNGIYIENGSCVLESTHVLRARQSGIVVAGSGSLICRRSIASSCAANGVIVTAKATASLDGCQLNANSKAGLLILEEGRFDALDSKFNQNGEEGIYVEGYGGKLQVCEVAENGKGGITAGDKSQLSLVHCKAEKNKGAGIFAKGSARVRLTDCDLSANEKSGVDIATAANLYGERSLFFANGYCGAIAHDGGKLRLDSCEIYENKGPALASDSKGIALLRSCKLSSKDAAAFCENGKLIIVDGKIQSEERSGVDITKEAKSALFRVSIEGCGYVGALVRNKSHLRAYDVAITNSGHAGIWVRDESRAWLRNGEITGSKEDGVRASGSAKVGILGSAVNNNGGFGVKVEETAATILGDVIFDQNQQGALSADEKTTVRERGCVDKSGGERKINPNAAYTRM